MSAANGTPWRIEIIGRGAQWEGMGGLPESVVREFLAQVAKLDTVIDSAVLDYLDDEKVRAAGVEPSVDLLRDGLPAFAVGDTVVLKGGSPVLTIIARERADITVVWMPQTGNGPASFTAPSAAFRLAERGDFHKQNR